MSRPGTVCRFVIIGLALAMPVSIGAADSPEGDDVPARQALVRHGNAFSRHMVRVRIQRSLEIRRTDGLKISTTILTEGFTTGLVVTAEPLILVTASEVIRAPKNLNPRLSSHPQNLSELQYILLLKNGSTVETEVVGRIETLNMLELRPRTLEQIPEELRRPLSLEGARRPIPGELLGLVSFSMPLRNSLSSTYCFEFPADRPEYARPVMALVSLSHLNCPLLAADGSLTGILNLSPRDTTSELSQDDLSAGSARDPMASAAAGKHAFLITGEELAVVLGDLIRKREPVVPFALLGFRLQMQGAALRIHSLIDPASDLPAGPTAIRPNDIVRGLAGSALQRLEEFEQILEHSLAQGTQPLMLELERDGQRLRIELKP